MVNRPKNIDTTAVTAPTPSIDPKRHDLIESKDATTTLDNGGPNATFPPDLIETAARAARGAQATHPDDQARLLRWWDEGLTSPEDRAVVERVARAVASVVAGPLRAEAWQLGAEFALRDQGHDVDVFVRDTLDGNNPFKES